MNGLLFAIVIFALAQPTVAANSSSGRALFIEKCAPCHGTSATGSGPAAEALATKPPNLRSGLLETRREDQLIAWVLDGRRRALRIDSAGLRSLSKEGDSLLAYLRKIPHLDWATASKGWWLYSKRCSECHGAFGAPPAQMPAGVKRPRNLASGDFQSSVSDAELPLVVRHGRRAMPALFPRVTKSEAEQLAALVRNLSPGFESYWKYCGQCHGDDGVGIGNFDSTVGAPTVVFDEEYFAQRSDEEVRARVLHMLRAEKPTMPHFRGEIDAEGVRAILEYLSALPKVQIE